MSPSELKSKGIKIFQTKIVKVGKTTINYAEAGEGKPLIMIHGWTNNWVGFIPLGLELIKNHRVIIVDLPGFGDSGTLPTYSLKIEADYIKKLIGVLNLKEPVVLGHSMGTYVAAKIYSSYPKLLSQVILVAPMLRQNNKRIRLKAAEWFFRVARRMNWSKRFMKYIVNTGKYTFLTAKYINMYKYDSSIIEAYGVEGKQKMSKDVYADMGVEIATTDIDNLIENNQIPIDLIFGDHDKLTCATKAEEILKGRGKYRIEVIKDAGHLVTVEQPKAAAIVIEKLLKTEEP